MTRGAVDFAGAFDVKDTAAKENLSYLQALRHLSLLTEDTITDAILTLGVPRSAIEQALPEALTLLPEDEARSLRSVPYAVENGQTLIATDDPFDLRRLAELQRRLPGSRLTYAPPQELTAALDALAAAHQTPTTPDPVRTAFHMVSDEAFSRAQALASPTRTLAHLLTGPELNEQDAFRALATALHLPFERHVPTGTLRREQLTEMQAQQRVAVIVDGPVPYLATPCPEAPQSLTSPDSQPLPVRVITPTLLRELTASLRSAPDTLPVSAPSSLGTPAPTTPPELETRTATHAEPHITPEPGRAASLNPQDLQDLMGVPVRPAEPAPPAIPRGVRPRSVGAALAAMNLLTPEEAAMPNAAERALQENRVSEEQFARALAAFKNCQYVNPDENPPDPEVRTYLPENLIKQYKVYPYNIDPVTHDLRILMADPRKLPQLTAIQTAARRTVVPVIATQSAINKQIQRNFERQNDLNALEKQLQDRSTVKVEEAQAVVVDDNAVVRVVNGFITEAHQNRASDIHIEPSEANIRVRFRVDGQLIEHVEMPKEAGASLVSRIKILSGMDITQKRIPQDGRIGFRQGELELNIRVSSVPTVEGEKVVMRLLARTTTIPPIDKLGLSDSNFERFRATIAKPYGIILITGPTGSGKTTTCFSVLRDISTPNKNTMTIEDPVEIRLAGINQVQVNNAAKLTFAAALRSFLRQDPDVILVGEIRDQETAQIALEAALTGHLVIATLHTNDAPGAVTRLKEMGVETFNISASLLGVMAQRLVRKVCSKCGQDEQPSEATLKSLGISSAAPISARRGKGCALCHQSGYVGRLAVHEFLYVDEDIREAIVAETSTEELRRIAIKNGMKTLREDGIAKALRGLTTFDEVQANTVS
ncbi:type II/IV secretion system protein [Deinococcus soli (ex Cha et al. 2016)]|uniref:Type IV pilus assembly protein PilB n=3 Tax=Deinococcus soli (ex Cha et al. 2016) TaxID=1309411 RepID=A0AAE3XD59_9DEIO|nr:type II/IV secretion system protein [Deinococcus soli (ex Cha et al. 2016)]MDR6218484.1 type IV pilus assembly protein PilB [Deinococcus soli (ex Cha et al. 2016)]MDR6329224.1 type IV pilus assembly protein PilB [Deinococcus soli (ex Cha et al. 2016)]MDR6751497.1 type IV pilus assembly protein PilB [Deinococcus soli (ex Cha et al. 2016)]